MKFTRNRLTAIASVASSVLRPHLSKQLALQHLGQFALLAALVGACSSPSTTGSSSSPTASPVAGRTNQDFTVGMVIVGPKNDAGWNQAHYEGMEAVAKNLGIKFEYADKVNPGDRPNVTGAQVADELIAKGAKMIIFNSDDFKDDALATAKKHPEVAIVHASGDYSWKEGKNYKNQPNLSNIMGRMEYGKMMAGCAAALGTETGKIGYLGSLINDETRRYSAAAYLGAKHCWETYRQRDAKDLEFKVTWIGFWFNIPGKTLDPTKVADDFYNGGYDVVMSGIDTPEAAIQGKKAAEAGKNVKYVHYDFPRGCDLAPDICLGVPIYNWALPYEQSVKDVMAGKKPPEFVWLGPDYQNISNPTNSMIGFIKGKGLTAENGKSLDDFIQAMASEKLNLYKGPLNLQDGTTYVKAGETATEQQIWYLPQLFAGMTGPSK